MADGYATMFPLYQAEYASIAEYVRTEFPPERQRQLLGHGEERPQRCPFLSPDRRCTIYAVRPLICRTYAVMNPLTIAAAVARHRGELPETWVRRFALREGGMACPRVVVTQPEKLVRHAYNLITSAYERGLLDLSRRVQLVGGERRQLARAVIQRRHWPVRWTWSGYSTVVFAPLDWLRDHLKDYWKKAELADAG